VSSSYTLLAAIGSPLAAPVLSEAETENNQVTIKTDAKFLLKVTLTY
jgi:hypothetical protein